MATSPVSLYQAARCAALVSALAAQPAMAQEAKLDRECTPHLTSIQQRLYQKASEGPDALRNFIFIRRAILQVDTYETAVWAASLSRAHAACMKKVSDTQTSPDWSG
jgi:hypothetical protein